jgi:hypothetical protein
VRYYVLTRSMTPTSIYTLVLVLGWGGAKVGLCFVLTDCLNVLELRIAQCAVLDIDKMRSIKRQPMKTRGSGGIAPCTRILHLETSFTPLPLYPLGKFPRYWLRVWVGPTARLDCGKKFLAPAGNRTQLQIAVRIQLSR